jgi:phage gp29-like protein
LPQTIEPFWEVSSASLFYWLDRMIDLTHKRTNGRADVNRQYIGWSRSLDVVRRYLTDDPTPARFATLQKSVDAGDYAAAVELCHEMEGKDDRLQTVAARRRGSLTALEWSCEANPLAKDQGIAKDAAAFCQDQLANLQTFPRTLKHLGDGIGPGIAVTELVWERARLIKTTDVPGHRLQDDVTGDSADVFIRTEYNLSPGVRAAPPKFVVHTPQMRTGIRLAVTLGRATMKLWLYKHFGWCDRMAFSEKFGMPIPQFKYPQGTTTEERTEIKNFARDSIADGFMLTRDDVELLLHTVSGQGSPHRDIVEDINTALSILWLGQSLTTDNTNTGSRALGEVHKQTEASITLSDMQEEAATIESQILTPMVRFRFPMRPDAPVPKWTRKIVEERNLAAEQLDFERVKYARTEGIAIDEGIMYELLGLPQPTEKPKPITTPTGVPGEPGEATPAAAKDEAATLNELTLAIERAVRAQDLGLVNAFRRKIAAQMGVSIPDLTSLPDVGGATP